VGNAAPLAVAQVCANALQLLSVVLLARILGVQSYGLLAIGIAMYGLTAFLSDAGLGIWGLRVIDDDPDRWATVCRLTVARCVTVSLALVLAFGAVLLLPLPAGATVPSLVMVVTMVPAGFAVDWALIGLERTGRAAAARLVVGVAMVALSPVLALAAGPTGAAAGYVAAAAIGCGVSWVLLVATIGRPRWTSPRGILSTLRSSLPMGASAVLGQVYWQSDSLLAGIMLGSIAAGLYAAPMRLLAAVVGLGWVVGTSLLPVYRALDAAEPASLSRLATTTTQLLVLASLPAVGATIGGASTILTTVLGPDFAKSAPVLAVGSITVAAWLCMVPIGYAIIARRHDHRYLAATLSAVVTSLPLILVLGGAGGIGGVAVAMLVAEVVAAIVITAGAARTGVRLPVVPIIVTVAVAVVVASVAGVAAAIAPFGIVGVVCVAVLAEAPFVASVALNVRRARRSPSMEAGRSSTSDGPSAGG
jgi:O-antigen/teichoic acid export membrane protein